MTLERLVECPERALKCHGLAPGALPAALVEPRALPGHETGGPCHPALAAEQHHRRRDVRGGGEDREPVPDPIHDRQEPAGIGGGVLETDDVGDARQALDRAEREVGALEAGIGVEHDRQVDGLGDRPEIGDDAILGNGEIRLEDGQDAVGAGRRDASCLGHRVGRRGRGDAGHHRHPLLAPPRP